MPEPDNKTTSIAVRTWDYDDEGVRVFMHNGGVHCLDFVRPRQGEPSDLRGLLDACDQADVERSGL